MISRAALQVANLDQGLGDRPAEQGRVLRMLTVGATGSEREAEALHLVRRWADETGIQTEHAPDLPRAVRRLAVGRWDLVFAALGDRAVEEVGWWIGTLRSADGTPRLIALAEHPSVSLAHHAEKVGVLDLLTLSPRKADFVRLLHNFRAVESERPVPLANVEAEGAGPHALVGQHPAMLDVYKLIARVASSNATVLIQGESGTGKEVVARALHQNSGCESGPFIAVNCAAIPENLLESELFGHEKGAFTGALTRKTGRFEQAVGGTLFLDEIADMSLALQAKILRAVQEREIQRVGGNETIPVNVRLVAATNRDLKDAIAQGKFREDLYYRLAIVTMQLPKLSERGDDLLFIASHFIRQFDARYGKTISSISDRALDLMRRHDWKGNVRELRNVMERAVLVASGETLRVEHLPEELRADGVRSDGQPMASAAQMGALGTLAETEAAHIARVLAHTRGANGAAAQVLGIHRNTLARKMKEYGM